MWYFSVLLLFLLQPAFIKIVNGRYVALPRKKEHHPGVEKNFETEANLGTDNTKSSTMLFNSQAMPHQSLTTKVLTIV